jgi:catechol 2,3-dioxygenase-like lactoylglutathione lyase family enzyme
MLEIEAIYEVVVPVADPSRAEKFYTGVLGLEVGLRDPRRPWLFLRAGGARGMLVLQQTADVRRTHFAFRVSEAEVERAAGVLRGNGVEVAGPVVHAWMPAKSLYFADPDGHELELCAPLAEAPR